MSYSIHQKARLFNAMLAKYSGKSFPADDPQSNITTTLTAIMEMSACVSADLQNDHGDAWRNKLMLLIAGSALQALAMQGAQEKALVLKRIAELATELERVGDFATEMKRDLH